MLVCCLVVTLTYQLMAHKERVHEELDHLFGESDRPCTRQDLSELKYLECCFKETLRLYPSVPVFFRLAAKSLQIGADLNEFIKPETFNQN